MPADDPAPAGGPLTSAVASRRLINEGDRVLLALAGGNTFLVKMRLGHTHSTHQGGIPHENVVGQPWGVRLETSTGRSVYALRPGWTDRMMKVHRRTNIMYPKDAAQIMAALDLESGARVGELGAGSGAMSIAIAHAVKPGGSLFSYDRRPEFLDLARENCTVADAADAVHFRLRDPGEPIEPDLDAIFCDIPEPWIEVDAMYQALRPSGRVAAGIPTFNQAERFTAALAGRGFVIIETTEVLLRSILARPGKTRPAHRMVGHTQLLTSAVKVVEPR